VVAKNSAGDVLTTTTLGRGRGSTPYHCEFGFSFTVMDGEKGGYVVTVSHRGDLHFTAAKLKLPDAVGLTLGS
jgi:hypothetical protein